MLQSHFINQEQVQSKFSLGPDCVGRSLVHFQTFQVSQKRQSLCTEEDAVATNFERTLSWRVWAIF